MRGFGATRGHQAMKVRIVTVTRTAARASISKNGGFFQPKVHPVFRTLPRRLHGIFPKALLRGRPLAGLAVNREAKGRVPNHHRRNDRPHVLPVVTLHYIPHQGGGDSLRALVDLVTGLFNFVERLEPGFREPVALPAGAGELVFG